MEPFKISSLYLTPYWNKWVLADCLEESLAVSDLDRGLEFWTCPGGGGVVDK